MMFMTCRWSIHEASKAMNERILMLYMALAPKGKQRLR